MAILIGRQNVAEKIQSRKVECLGEFRELSDKVWQEYTRLTNEARDSKLLEWPQHIQDYLLSVGVTEELSFQLACNSDELLE